MEVELWHQMKKQKTLFTQRQAQLVRWLCHQFRLRTRRCLCQFKSRWLRHCSRHTRCRLGSCCDIIRSWCRGKCVKVYPRYRDDNWRSNLNGDCSWFNWSNRLGHCERTGVWWKGHTRWYHRYHHESSQDIQITKETIVINNKHPLRWKYQCRGCLFDIAIISQKV